MDKKTYVVIQARMGSTRRPGKISYLFDNEAMLAYQIKRLKSYNIENIIVATSDDKKDDVTEDIVLNEGVECFRGSENDLIKRYYECSVKYNLKKVGYTAQRQNFLLLMLLKKLIHLHQKVLKESILFLILRKMRILKK